VNDVDFTPRWYRKKIESVKNRQRRMCFLALIGLLMFCWGVINEGRIRSALAALESARQSHQQSQLLQERLGNLRQKKNDLQQLNEWYDELARHLAPSVVFAEISHHIPDGACLSSFRLEPIAQAEARGPSRAAATEDPCRFGGSRIVISAQATDRGDLVVFIENLRESHLFAGIHASATKMRDIGGTVVKEVEIQACALSAEFIGP
jgi:Tfp pilus assembly protein PilN